jgi:hypothetical protein
MRTKQEKENAMVHLTNVQFLAGAIAVFLVIAIAIGLFRANHKMNKVAFYEFTDAEYDLELLQKGDSGEAADWMADRPGRLGPSLLQESFINDLGSRAHGANWWDNDLN